MHKENNEPAENRDAARFIAEREEQVKGHALASWDLAVSCVRVWEDAEQNAKRRPVTIPCVGGRGAKSETACVTIQKLI